MLMAVAGTALLFTSFSYLMVQDVRRIRLRTQILATANPLSDLYKRNLPRKSTRWGTDSENVDKWSARVCYVWWLWRALFCLLSTAFVTGLHILLHHGKFDAALWLYWPFFIVFIFGGSLRRQCRLAETDLEVARAFHGKPEDCGPGVLSR